MAGGRLPRPPGAGAAALAAPAFRAAPAAFPLLWMARRLARHHRLGAKERTGTPARRKLPSPLSSAKELMGIRRRRGDAGCERLVEWLDGRGGSTSRVRVGADARGLRGLYAAEDARPGEVLVEVPYSAALLVGDSLRAPVFDDFGDVPGSRGWEEEDLDDAYQGLDFLRTFVDGREYAAHAPYVDALPPRPASGDEAGLTPDFWCDESIRGIQVPSYVDRILARKRMIREVARRNGVDEADLRWATFALRSRRFTTWNNVPDPGDDGGGFGAFPIRLRTVEQVQGFLLPLVEMANHDQDPNAALKISVNMWTRAFDETSTFALRALRAIRRGEEVTLCYGDGDRTSLDLLDKYGFFVDNNEADDTIDWKELKPEFTTSLEEDKAELAALEKFSGTNPGEENKPRALAKTTEKLKTIASRMQDYEPSFPPALDGLQLLGSGVRKKMGIKIYAVAAYGPPALRDATSGPSSAEALRRAARSFDVDSSGITFVLETILRPDAPGTLAGAIAGSVRRRHDGPEGDVRELERLIAEGVERGGGTGGDALRFDCTAGGVSVGAGGTDVGTAGLEGLAGALVDVFLDENSVSPSLVEDCLGRGRDGGDEGGAGTDEDGRNLDSRRTMLSLRVLMKRLSGWKPKGTDSTTADGTPAQEGVPPESPGDDAEATASANEGLGSLGRHSSISSPHDEMEATALVNGGVETLGPDSSDSPSDVSVGDATLSSPPDDEIDAMDSVDEDGSLEPNFSESASGVSAGDVTLVSAPDDEIEEGSLVDESLLGPSGPDLSESPSDVSDGENASQRNGIAMQNFTAFDPNDIEEQIRRLEAEIEVEIARVRSEQGEDPVDDSVRTPDDTIVADPAPDPGNEDQAALEEQAKQRLKDEERQKTEKEAADRAAAEARERIKAVESRMRPLKDKATGVEFGPKLEDGLYLVGAGVRKKAILNIYSVAMYASPSTPEALSPFSPGKQRKEAWTALNTAARSFGPSSPATVFVLEMVFKANAETIAGALAENVRPRYDGPPSDVGELERLIISGVQRKGGQATKGTVFRFDCTAGGVRVSVDGREEGTAGFGGMGTALADAFTDDRAVSPQLIDSCLNTWCESGL